ncbi:hypothetical protein [Streptacidiphilus sp. EB129]|jgi:hypothetical protein|uniref:hypothetical protein n=1 Tax=Streptacidiphilus sp. EB129 TaxID=3156262 RepID=UPI00351749AC
MNARHFLAAAMAGSAILAVTATSAQAATDPGRRAGGPGGLAAAAAKTAVPVVQGAVADRVGQKVGAVQNTLEAGEYAARAVNGLVGS